ncbi:hypothetical protein [Dyadobacter sp. LHD-138]|uniref:hypothetical protein n=1 Tax=Dyadobacter sp. LHD-138 TaxID=3071413 RepID=UPI0027E02124|nr:hypothetical protein [Dyadobacter sp. LHD-138]MDQ6478231.1 hypothetical protein [Dyadobacter sp. LHD-138]
MLCNLDFLHYVVSKFATGQPFKIERIQPVLRTNDSLPVRCFLFALSKYRFGFKNVLEDIWFAPEQSRIYSPFMWYMLKEKRFSNNQQEPLVQTIKSRWDKFELDKDMDDATVQLLFKNGGIYDADNLHTRATMLNQLQSTIRSVSQDMQSLISSLNSMKHEKN